MPQGGPRLDEDGRDGFLRPVGDTIARDTHEGEGRTQWRSERSATEPEPTSRAHQSTRGPQRRCVRHRRTSSSPSISSAAETQQKAPTRKHNYDSRQLSCPGWRPRGPTSSCCGGLPHDSLVSSCGSAHSWRLSVESFCWARCSGCLHGSASPLSWRPTPLPSRQRDT